MLDDILVIGFAAAFWSYLTTKSSAMPKWWYSFQNWWSKISPFGNKPFGCSVCMSFWSAVLFSALFLYLYSNNFSFVNVSDLLTLLFLSSGSAAVSILYLSAVERLETFSIG